MKSSETIASICWTERRLAFISVDKKCGHVTSFAACRVFVSRICSLAILHKTCNLCEHLGLLKICFILLSGRDLSIRKNMTQLNVAMRNVRQTVKLLQKWCRRRQTTATCRIRSWHRRTACTALFWRERTTGKRRLSSARRWTFVTTLAATRRPRRLARLAAPDTPSHHRSTPHRLLQTCMHNTSGKYVAQMTNIWTTMHCVQAPGLRGKHLFNFCVYLASGQVNLMFAEQLMNVNIVWGAINQS